MKKILLVPLILTSCVYSQPKVFGPQTAGDYYSTLKGNGQREIFNKGYDYAQADASGELYAAEHNIQNYALNHTGSSQKKEISLHRTILRISVPGDQDSDGEHSPSKKYVELPQVE